MTTEERSALFNLLTNGQVVIMTDDDRDKINTGEAKGFGRYGEIVQQSPVQPCTEDLFPYRIGDGADFLQIWAISESGVFKPYVDSVIGFCKGDASTADSEIIQRLEPILAGNDAKWRLRQVEFLSASVIKLWFGGTSEPWLRFGAAPNLSDNAITEDFTKTPEVTLQIRQSASRNHRPHRKFLYKIKANEEFGCERILGCWAAGSGTVLYRIYGDQQLQTVEKYPDGVDLLIENL